jgi:hypothetical protein
MPCGRLSEGGGGRNRPENLPGLQDLQRSDVDTGLLRTCGRAFAFVPENLSQGLSVPILGGEDSDF